MTIIYKYPLDMSKESTEIEIPSLSSFLHCAMQGDSPTLWFRVDTDMPMQKRTFRIIGTGQTISEDPSVHLLHLGTVMDNTFVWHIFEENIFKGQEIGK